MLKAALILGSLGVAICGAAHGQGFRPDVSVDDINTGIRTCVAFVTPDGLDHSVLTDDEWPKLEMRSLEGEVMKTNNRSLKDSFLILNPVDREDRQACTLTASVADSQKFEQLVDNWSDSIVEDDPVVAIVEGRRVEFTLNSSRHGETIRVDVSYPVEQN